jgi:hypothetical protein
MAIDPHSLLHGLEEISRLAKDAKPGGNRIGEIADRLKRDLEEETARARQEAESGRGPGLIQPPKDN